MLYNESSVFGPLAYVGAIPDVGHVEQMQERLLGWNVPPEHLELVHPHWRGFLAPGKYWHIGLALIYFMLLVLSFVGNGCVVWIFTTSRSLRTPSNIFVVNLALFDLLMALEMPMLIVNSFLERMMFWEVGCDVYAILGSISGIGSAINNAAIAFDRYKTISCPIDGRLNGKQAGIIVAFTWFWALPFSVLPITKVWGRYTTEGFLTTCSFDYLTEDQDTKVFTGCIFVWAYAIPMCLIVYFYSQLIKSVRRHEKMLREQAKKMNMKSLVSNQDKDRGVEMRIAKVAFTIFFLFVCSWTPYAVVAMMGAYGNRESLTPFTTMIPALFAKVVSCIDPWVYAINHPRYRIELQKRCQWMGIREPELPHETVSTTTEKIKTDEA
ncbi:opsin, blue-sensitive [Orussus abietinus]|uniref:Short wavelength sensitive opsin n=1 Tax=Orussus abietinus TaxID=222816 RepID=A0A1P8SF61_ORUAB|nr:opsin, blue-sensitive [Orussus abietinus]APY20536.1 short wavelength sensitive opsin [Orussus abietinus]